MEGVHKSQWHLPRCSLLPERRNKGMGWVLQIKVMKDCHLMFLKKKVTHYPHRIWAAHLTGPYHIFQVIFNITKPDYKTSYIPLSLNWTPADQGALSHLCRGKLQQLTGSHSQEPADCETYPTRWDKSVGIRVCNDVTYRHLCSL